MRIPTHADAATLHHAAEPPRRPRSRPGFTAYVALCAFAGLRRDDVVTVQRAMGHASATTTLSTCAHLWPTAEDETRAAAAAMAAEALDTGTSDEATAGSQR